MRTTTRFPFTLYVDNSRRVSAVTLATLLAAALSSAAHSSPTEATQLIAAHVDDTGTASRPRSVDRSGAESAASDFIDYGIDPRDLDLGALMSTAKAPNATCALGRRVAFAVMGGSHLSEGCDRILLYPETVSLGCGDPRGPFTNLDDAWIEPFNSNYGAFTAPCAGLYSFSVNFEKNPHYGDGTTDDVYVRLFKVPYPYNPFVAWTSLGDAWAGETGQDEDVRDRQSASYTTVVVLNQGDIVLTMVGSDGQLPPLGVPCTCRFDGYQRRISNYSFTGHLVH